MRISTSRCYIMVSSDLCLGKPSDRRFRLRRRTCSTLAATAGHSDSPGPRVAGDPKTGVFSATHRHTHTRTHAHTHTQTCNNSRNILTHTHTWVCVKNGGIPFGLPLNQSEKGYPQKRLVFLLGDTIIWSKDRYTQGRDGHGLTSLADKYKAPTMIRIFVKLEIDLRFPLVSLSTKPKSYKTYPQINGFRFK